MGQATRATLRVGVPTDIGPRGREWHVRGASHQGRQVQGRVKVLHPTYPSFLLDTQPQWIKMPPGTKRPRPAVGTFVVAVVDKEGTVTALRVRGQLRERIIRQYELEE